MNTFLPYKSFKKSARCLDYRRLGKQRIETWQIYKALKQGLYTTCPNCGGNGENTVYPFQKCKRCNTTGKIKTPWYNHPIVKMWKGYEDALLVYGKNICEEWIDRHYKDTMWERFCTEIVIRNKKLIYPPWLGKKVFHDAMKSNLLRKDLIFYSKYKWEVSVNLPYYYEKTGFKEAI